jgi:hypothetical protein
MTDTRLLEMQARQLEGNPLTGPETLELEEARKGDGHMARLLKDDLQLHADLLVLHRIESTGVEFAKRCVAPTVDSEPAIKTLVPSLDVASPLDRLRRSRPKRRSPKGRTAVWIAAIAASTLVVLGAWLWMPRTENNPVAVAGTANDTGLEDRSEDRVANRVDNLAEQPVFDEFPDSQMAVDADEPGLDDEVIAERRLAEMRYTPDSEWEIMPLDGFSYPTEYKLRSGVAEVVLDDGTEVVFQGPAIMTLESPRRMRVDEGRFRVQPVAGKQDFSITTPTVLLNGQNEVLAYLDVGPVDGTLVQIERGALKARPWANQRAEELSLAANGMDRGIFGPAWRDDSPQPATAVAMNEDGQFSSLIAAGDRPLRISSPTVFAQVLDTSRTMIREDPTQFSQQWQGMVENLDNSAANTDLNINGQSVRPTTPDEMMKQFNSVREQMMSGMPGGTNGNSSSAFSGMLNVNGQEQRFTSPEEFQEAQQRMFGPMFGRIMMSQMQIGGNGNGTNGASGSGALGGSGQGFGMMTGGSKLPGFENGTSSRSGQPTGESNSMSTFSGMMNINGQVRQFTSPEDFNRAMQQLRPRRQ